MEDGVFSPLSFHLADLVEDLDFDVDVDMRDSFGDLMRVLPARVVSRGRNSRRSRSKSKSSSEIKSTYQLTRLPFLLSPRFDLDLIAPALGIGMG